jgi:hypothetical protein
LTNHSTKVKLIFKEPRAAALKSVKVIFYFAFAMAHLGGVPCGPGYHFNLFVKGQQKGFSFYPSRGSAQFSDSAL